MGNSKHTPGPWKVGKLDSVVVSDSDKNLTINGATGKENTDYYGGNLICESVSSCNAKLIAAAPELLEVLQGLVSDVGNLLSEYDIEWQEAGYYTTAIELLKKATE